MKHLLVTGGAGFIGSNFIRYMLSHEPDIQIVNLDLLTYAGSLENLRDLPHQHRHTFVKGDINDRSLLDTLLRKHNIDTIVHFAAQSHVDRSIHDPDTFIETNVVGTFTLLESTRAYWLEEKAHPIDAVLFHHISTDEVFGTLEPQEPAFSEESVYAPRSPYAASKASSDHLVRAYHHTYGLPITISNCSNNYGPYQFPEKFLPLMILNAQEGKPLPIYGDGLQIRDWLYVDDHCEAIRRVIKSGVRGDTYCIGGNNQSPNIEIVKSICQILDELQPGSPHIPHASLIKHVTDRPGHDRRYDVSIKKIKNELAWTPEESLTTGLLKTVQWYLNNPDWIENLKKESDLDNWLDENYYKR